MAEKEIILQFVDTLTRIGRPACGNIPCEKNPGVFNLEAEYGFFLSHISIY